MEKMLSGKSSHLQSRRLFYFILFYFFKVVIPCSTERLPSYSFL